MQNLIYELFDYLNEIEKSHRITIRNLHERLQEDNTDSDRKIKMQIEENSLKNIKNLQDIIAWYIRENKLYAPLVINERVFVSNEDKSNEILFGKREHDSFFGTVIAIEKNEDDRHKDIITCKFPFTDKPLKYYAEELSTSQSIESMTYGEISKKYGAEPIFGIVRKDDFER